MFNRFRQRAGANPLTWISPNRRLLRLFNFSLLLFAALAVALAAALENSVDVFAAALEAHAETGVKSDAELRESFDAAARRALAAAGQAKAGGGVSGLMARARSRKYSGDHSLITWWWLARWS